MNSSTVKSALYGSIVELMKDSACFYNSSVGDEFCHWTPRGEAELLSIITALTPAIVTANNSDLNTRAKELVLDGLSSNANTGN